MLFAIILHTVSTVILICCVSAQQQLAWTSATFPDPREDFIQCGLRAPGRICDPDGILSEQEVLSLERFIEDAEISTKNDINQPLNCRNPATGSLLSGLQFYIVVFNKLDNNGANVNLETFKNFTKELEARYNLSKYGQCDKIIIIAISKGDGKLFTRASTDVQLSDAIFDDAFARNKDLFTSGQYAAGLTEMIAIITYAYKQALINALSEDLQQSSQIANTIAIGNNGLSTITTSPLMTTTSSNPATAMVIFPRRTNPVTATMVTTFATTSTTLGRLRSSKLRQVNGSSFLSPAAQSLWLGVVIATFKFFSN